MNKTANAILWIGLFLISMMLWAHWSQVRKLIFTPEGSAKPGLNFPGFFHIPPFLRLPGSPLPMP